MVKGDFVKVFKKIKAFFDLVRIEHAFFLAIAVLVGAIMGAKANPNIMFSIFASGEELVTWATIIFFGMMSPFFIEMGSFAINDYWDMEEDKHNKRKDRPLITGLLKPKTALIVTIITIPLGLLFAYFINMTVFYIAILFSIISFYYSYDLKKRAVIGNTSIALSMAIPFIFGNLIMYSEIDIAVWVLAVMAFLMGLGREIFKSIQDMAGDKKAGRKTLPIVINKEPARMIASLLIVLAVLISFYPLFYIAAYYGDMYYFSFILIADILLIGSIELASKGEWNKVRKHTLEAQGIGLLGFLLGILF